MGQHGNSPLEWIFHENSKNDFSGQTAGAPAKVPEPRKPGRQVRTHLQTRAKKIKSHKRRYDNSQRFVDDGGRTVRKRPSQMVRREWEAPSRGSWVRGVARGAPVPRPDPESPEHDVDLYHVGSSYRGGRSAHSLLRFWGEIHTLDPVAGRSVRSWGGHLYKLRVSIRY